jgi:hypothetical protein
MISYMKSKYLLATVVMALLATLVSLVAKADAATDETQIEKIRAADGTSVGAL